MSQWRRGLFEKDQAKDNHGSTKERRCNGSVSRQPVTDHDRTGDTENVERKYLDIEGDDQDQDRNADTSAKNQGKRSPGGDESRPQDAYHDEGQRRHALGNGAGKGSPEHRRKSVPGPSIRGPAKPPACQCFQILREEPHPHDEEAEPAKNPAEQFDHAYLNVRIVPVPETCGAWDVVPLVCLRL